MIDTAAGSARRVAVHEQPRSIGDVLVERSAQRDVQYLMPAADGEDGYVASERSIEQRELEAVQHVVDAVNRWMRLLPVPSRIDVRTAGEDKTGEGCDHVRRVAVVFVFVQFGRRQQHWLRARTRQCIGVTTREGDRACGPRRDA